MVEVHTLPAREAIELKRGDILTRGKLSDATVQTIRVAALDEQACAKPISLGVRGGLGYRDGGCHG